MEALGKFACTRPILCLCDEIHDDCGALRHRIDERHHLLGCKRALGFAGGADRYRHAVLANCHIRIRVARIIDYHHRRLVITADDRKRALRVINERDQFVAIHRATLVGQPAPVDVNVGPHIGHHLALLDRDLRNFVAWHPHRGFVDIRNILHVLRCHRGFVDQRGINTWGRHADGRRLAIVVVKEWIVAGGRTPPFGFMALHGIRRRQPLVPRRCDKLFGDGRAPVIVQALGVLEEPDQSPAMEFLTVIKFPSGNTIYGDRRYGIVVRAFENCVARTDVETSKAVRNLARVRRAVAALLDEIDIFEFLHFGHVMDRAVLVEGKNLGAFCDHAPIRHDPHAIL